MIAGEEGFRLEIKAHLEGKGYSVFVVGDQVEAIGLLDSTSFEVILWRLVPEDEYKWILMDYLGALSMGPKVILMVEKGQLSQSIEGMRRGAFDEVFTPFAWESLEEKIEQAIEAVQKAKKGREDGEWWKDILAGSVLGEARPAEEIEQVLRESKRPIAKRDKTIKLD